MARPGSRAAYASRRPERQRCDRAGLRHSLRLVRLARKGARVVAIDNSLEQLATARRLQLKHGLDFPLIHGNAESVAYPDASFDFVIFEYGACLWADPQLWVPEAARVLRPGGQLVFLTNSHLMTLCMPPQDDIAATDQLLRPTYAGVEFHLSHGDWNRLLRQSGFEIEDLIEVRPQAEATTNYPFVTLEWARKWPCDEVWKVRKKS
jgi:SAM-dependent methyltransferase